jgi:hypothetical protein
VQTCRYKQHSSRTPDTGALCTTAVDKVSTFPSHYWKLFSPSDVCSPAETQQRAQSASTVHRLRATHTADAPALEEPFCLGEVQAALSRMANHKAPGADGLPTELLKYSGPSSLQILRLLCNLIYDRECIPQGWREGTLVPAAKSGDLTNCANYRGLNPTPCYQQTLQPPEVATGEPACRAQRSPIRFSAWVRDCRCPVCS